MGHITLFAHVSISPAVKWRDADGFVALNCGSELPSIILDLVCVPMIG